MSGLHNFFYFDFKLTYSYTSNSIMYVDKQNVYIVIIYRINIGT